MHVDGADGHDLRPVAGAQAPEEQRDERVQLTDLQEQRPGLGHLGAPAPRGGGPGWVGPRELTVFLFSVMKHRQKFPEGWGELGSSPPWTPLSHQEDATAEKLVLWHVVDSP